jgi:hypothetical protein
MVTELDVSGNGKNGTYNKTPVFTAGLVPGDTAWAPPNVVDNYITVPDLTVSCLTPWSMDFWYQQDLVIDDNDNIGFFLAAAADIVHNQVSIYLYNSIGQLNVQTGGVSWQATITAANDHAAHHLAITYNGNTTAPVVAVYIDGVSVSVAQFGLFSFFPPTAPPDSETFATNSSFNQFVGTFDEFAIYPSVLSSGRVAAHYAAGTSFAAYTAAVLADSPAVYYHFTGHRGWVLGQVGIS